MIYEALFDRFNKVYPLKPEIRQRLEDIFEVVEYPRHHHLLKEGEVCNYMWIVIKGLIRVYYYKDGEELTSRLMAENYFITSFISYFTRSKSTEYLEAYEQCVLIRISITNIQKLYCEFPEFNYTARVLTEYSFFLAEQRTIALRKTNVLERIGFFFTHHSEIVNRVAAKHIASYLGITAEEYSRGKKKFLGRVDA